MKMVSAFMQMVPNTLYMKSIKKIRIDKGLEIDKTGHDVGKIYLNRLSKRLFTDEFKSYFLKFEKGSKSKIHLHDSDQIIIGMGGIGKIVIFSRIDEQKGLIDVEQSLELEEGDAVLIPAGKLHWHGATENHDSSQISFMKNGKTFWF